MSETNKNTNKSMFLELRKRICKSVIEFAKDKIFRKDKIREALDPLFAEVNDSMVPEEDGVVTPLMEACYSRNVACLEYFNEISARNETYAAIIGPPEVHTNNDGNTALHHAGLSGCYEIIPTFQDKMGQDILALASSINDHGDTPLMMAAVNGHAEFIKKWYSHATRNGKTNKKKAQEVLEMINKSKDTAFSLACCHGNVPVVKFLLRDRDVELKMEQVDQCRKSFEKMTYGMKTSLGFREKFKVKYVFVKDCMSMMNKVIDKRADEVAEQLMMEEKSEVSQTKTKKKKKKKKTKQKKPTDILADAETHNANNENEEDDNQKKNGKPSMVVDLTTTEQGNFAVRVEGTTETTELDKTDDNDAPAAPSEKKTCLVVDLTTTEQGNVAVRVEGTKEAEAETTDSHAMPSAPMFATSGPEVSANEMLRRRLQGYTEVDAVMDALCLDVSMLLYTPHGMALNLSPSQLEAVQSILNKQLSSVQEAQEIQRRVHATSAQWNENGA